MYQILSQFREIGDHYFNLGVDFLAPLIGRIYCALFQGHILGQLLFRRHQPYKPLFQFTHCMLNLFDFSVQAAFRGINLILKHRVLHKPHKILDSRRCLSARQPIQNHRVIYLELAGKCLRPPRKHILERIDRRQLEQIGTEHHIADSVESTSPRAPRHLRIFMRQQVAHTFTPVGFFQTDEDRGLNGAIESNRKTLGCEKGDHAFLRNHELHDFAKHGNHPGMMDANTAAQQTNQGLVFGQTRIFAPIGQAAQNRVALGLDDRRYRCDVVVE